MADSLAKVLAKENGSAVQRSSSFVRALCTRTDKSAHTFAYEQILKYYTTARLPCQPSQEQ